MIKFQNIFSFKKIVKPVIYELLYGPHLLAFGAASIIITAQLLLEAKKVDFFFPFLIYLIAYSAYLYNRYKEIEEDFRVVPERVMHLRNYFAFVPYILLTIFMFLLFVSFYFLLSKKYLLSVGIIGLFLGGILYSKWVKEQTKYIPLLKNFYVALEWTFPLIIIPLYCSLSYDLPLLTFSIFVFLKTFIMNSFFDLKDISIDSQKKLKTLPVLWGTANSLFLYIVATIISYVFLFISIILKVLPKPVYGLFIWFIVDLIIFFRAKYFFSYSLYFVKGIEFLTWPFLIMLFK